MRDDGRTPTENRVPGEQRTFGLQDEGQGVRRMSGRRDNPQEESIHVDDGAVRKALVTQPVSRIECSDGRPGELAQSSGAFGVIRVAMGEQDLGNRPLCGRDNGL